MRAEFAATPEMVSAPPVAPTEPVARASAEVEPALIGRILWRRRKLIAGAALLAGLAALAYSLIATPQYNAVAQILVDPRDKQVVSNDVNPSSIAADGGVTQVESQGSVLQSSGVLLRAIAATHLESDPEFNGSGLFSALTRFASLLSRPDPAEMAERLKAETLQTLRKHMVVKRAEKVLVLDLSVRARTADRAAELANAIADAYLADQADARSAAGREASNALAGRLDELQRNVEKAENAVADYRAAHDFVISAGTLVSDQELNATTAQLTSAQNRVASLKSQLDQLRAGNAEATPEAMASGVMVRLRDRESAIVEKLGDASKKYGPLHPEIASLNQSLADVRALIAKEAQRLRQAAQADYARAVDDEKALAKKLTGMKEKSLDDVKADTQLRQLQSQAETARSLYQAFLSRSRETMEASNVDTTNARIITRALPPIQKSWPPTLLLVLGASFLGLSLSASGALAREYLRPTLHTPAQAREIAGTAALGAIPVDELRPDAQSRRALDALALKALRALGEDDSADGVSVGRVLCLSATSAAAPYRQRLAERIAALAAAEGRETLLIDANLAEPAASDRPGLLDFLRGDQTAADLAYRESGESFARLAVGGGDPMVAPKRGGGDAFRLRRLKRHYETLVIDAAVLGDNPRMAALTTQAEYVLILASLGEPQSELAREVEAAGRVDGVALIDAGLV
jgi:uncharacterized protein involved in exopolysaccharide biosynthesis